MPDTPILMAAGSGVRQRFFLPDSPTWCADVSTIPFVDTHFAVHTPIILTYIVVVHTAGTGRLT